MTDDKRAALAAMTMLIVDDHMIILKELSRMLKKKGAAHIDTAANAAEAAAKLDKLRYDVVFLDWHMPDKSGYDLMLKYRENKDYDNTAFVMITAKSETKYILEALRARATSYMIKPIDDRGLDEHLDEVLKWRETQEKLAR